jgi:hypothetical protein
MRALIVEDMQQLAIECGGKFLSKKFLGRDSEHTWRCNKGHVFDMRPRFVQRGAWCPQCTIHDKKIAALELMQEWAEKRGGKCLSKIYINNTTPLEWECKQGHRFKKTRDHYKQQKKPCVQCELDKLRKRNLLRIQKIALSKSGRCLSLSFYDLYKKLEFECAFGHQWQATPHIIIYHGSWCPHCYGNIRHTIEDMQKLAAKRKGKCISKKYTNTVTPLMWECNKGHKWRTRPFNIKSGTWCPKCHLIKVKTTDFVNRWRKDI